MENTEKIKALAYMLTFSATNVGKDNDSMKRQRAAISSFAKKADFKIEDADWFYDAAVKEADTLESRPAFNRLLDRIEGNGVGVVIIEDASRFARDLMTQELGILSLVDKGVRVITATGDDLTDTSDPVKKAMRQIAGAFADLEKARLVAKLKGARERKKAETGKCGGRKTYNELDPAMVAEVHRLNDGRSLREIAAGLAAAGFKSRKGNVFAPTSIKNMLAADFAGSAMKRTTARGKRILSAKA